MNDTLKNPSYNFVFSFAKTTGGRLKDFEKQVEGLTIQILPGQSIFCFRLNNPLILVVVAKWKYIGLSFEA